MPFKNRKQPSSSTLNVVGPLDGVSSSSSSSATLQNPRQSSANATADLLRWHWGLHFSTVNARFDGYEYINLQLTRIHGELLLKEVLQIVEMGMISTQSVCKTLLSNSRSSHATAPVVNQRIGASLLAGSTLNRTPAYLFSPSYTTFLRFIQAKQEQRQLYEETHWRLPSDLSSQQTEPMPTKRTLENYRELFDADFRSTKPFVYKFDPGDAKAVRYTPSFVDLFDTQRI